ncbi:endonuclease domain-containing protein [Agromyces sp. GXS1127]|uniref:endonuclease domain-containing protein n=1 Tax=Agromyces sp. GXS1127 TaxID=3424181 RepID=UPI003D31C346
MPRPAPLPLDLQLGPFHVRTASERGIPRSRLRAPDLVAPYHGVRSAAVPTSVRDRCGAYVERMRVDQWFSHTTAAQLWELPLPSRLEREHRLHVSSSRREPEAAGVIGHRIVERPAVQLHLGLPVLGPAETWCQLGAVLPVDALVEAGERLLAWPAPLCTPADIERAVTAHRGRRGAVAIAAAYPLLRDRAASPRETRLRLRLVAAGLPEPLRNHPIRLLDGRTVHGDLVYDAERVVVEYDGEQHRPDDAQFARDVDRLNALALAGWLVIRIRKDMGNDEVVDLVRSALMRRSVER